MPLMKWTKEDKLEHYAKRELKKFIQYDFFTDVAPDSVMQPDEESDDLWTSLTHELMTGLPAVRVLVVPGTPEKDVIRGLLKILMTVNREGLETEERLTGGETQ